MIGLPEAAWSKDGKNKKENKEGEDNKSHLHTTNISIQHYNSKQSTLSDFTT